MRLTKALVLKLKKQGLPEPTPPAYQKKSISYPVSSLG
jgi:hypothetical protein